MLIGRIVGAPTQGDFTRSPIRLLAATYDWEIGATEGGPAGTDVRLKFKFTPGSRGELTHGPDLVVYGDGNTQTGMDPPQWHEDEPNADAGLDGFYSVRYKADLGVDALTGSPSGDTTPPSNGETWALDEVEAFSLRSPRTANDVKTNASIYEIFETTSGILKARATITLIIRRAAT